MDARLAPLSRRRSAAAFLLYGTAAAAFLGLELAFHRGGRTYLGIGADPQIGLWAFGWWPHAILHGQNPIVTHAIWAPDGVDLAWTAGTVPALALAFAPLTLLVGAFASFQVAYVLMPALAAWAAFLLCRHLTRAFWPAFAGGWLFGFSSYVLGQLQGHVFLTAVFALPLLALAVLRFLDGELGPRGLALRCGVLVAVQLAISTEVAFTATLALAVALVLGLVLAPARRRRIVAAAPALLGAYVLAAAIDAPLLWYWVSDFRRGRVNPASPDTFALDALNLVVPTPVTALGHWWVGSVDARFTAGHAESGAYLGLPLLAILGIELARRRRTAAARFLLAAFLVTAAAASGTWLRVDGHRLVTMPWEHVGYLPLFDDVLPARLSVYLALVAAVGAAGFAASASSPRAARAGLVALAAVAIAPNPTLRWTTVAHEPAFIADGLYQRCLRRGEDVAVFPFSRHGDSMLWQVDAGFWFRQSGGYVAPLPPPSFTTPPGVADVSSFGLRSEAEPGPLLELVRLKHVDVVLVDSARSEPWRSLLRGVRTPRAVGGVLLYRFRGTTPAACAAATVPSVDVER
jgi:hypothetical protein